MNTILAIDPGDQESAYALLDAATRRPIETGKVPNHTLIHDLSRLAQHGQTKAVAIEMIRSYGMAVGMEVFETCVWIGRFQQELIRLSGYSKVRPELIYRGDVKLHHCHSVAAKDGNVTQALVDRFTPGARNFGKGTKDEPGWFHGFKADIWQAYALGVLVADRLDQ